MATNRKTMPELVSISAVRNLKDCIIPEKYLKEASRAEINDLENARNIINLTYDKQIYVFPIEEMQIKRIDKIPVISDQKKINGKFMELFRGLYNCKLDGLNEKIKMVALLQNDAAQNAICDNLVSLTKQCENIFHFMSNFSLNNFASKVLYIRKYNGISTKNKNQLIFLEFERYLLSNYEIYNEKNYNNEKERLNYNANVMINAVMQW